VVVMEVLGWETLVVVSLVGTGPGSVHDVFDLEATSGSD
jgi:hypothetical protein